MTEGSFEVLCPDSASDISRGAFPTGKGLEWRLRREEETSQCQLPAARAVLPRADVLPSAFATYLQLAVFIHSQVTWLQVLQQTGAEKLDVSSCNPSTQLSVESLLVFDVVP